MRKQNGQIILTTPEEKEAFLKSLPTGPKHGFYYECPYCKQKIKLPYEVAGKQLKCSCNFESTIRNLTPEENRTYNMLKMLPVVQPFFMVLLVLLLLVIIFTL